MVKRTAGSPNRGYSEAKCAGPERLGDHGSATGRFIASKRESPTMAKTSKHVPLDFIRGLVLAQSGRCAITGTPLDPHDVNADHISPVSRKDLEPPPDEKNVWLVDKKVNVLKGALTDDELVELAKLILQHEGRSRHLMKLIREGAITPVDKQRLDEWVNENCDEEGTVCDGSRPDDRRNT